MERKRKLEKTLYGNAQTPNTKFTIEISTPLMLAMSLYPSSPLLLAIICTNHFSLELLQQHKLIRDRNFKPASRIMGFLCGFQHQPNHIRRILVYGGKTTLISKI
jgi:hypothetical protein